MSTKALHRSKRSMYSAQAMHMAYNSVKSGQYTGRQAAAMFKVPYGTLTRKLSGRDLTDGQGSAGRPLEIGAENERKLADYLYVAGRWGHGISRREILELTAEFIREEGIRTRWTNGIPGFDWLRSFLKRHPRVMTRKDEVCSALQVNSLDVCGFYEDLEHLYEKEKVTSTEAHRVYSVLEISLPYEEQANIPEILQNDQLKATVFTCISADEEKLPPLVVFQGKCVTCENNTDCNGASKQAERALFCYWFENIFIPLLPRSGKSIILFFEGKSLQINLRILQLAKRNCVFFVKFPPKLANHLQPLALECSSALKLAYDNYLQSWNKKTFQNTEDTQREKFGDIIGTTWKTSAKKDIVIEGFQKSGLFPLDKSKFDENVFSEPPLKQLKEWKNPEFMQGIEVVSGDLQSGINEFEISVDSLDLQTPKITHATSVASKDVTSTQHLISISSKASLLHKFPRIAFSESSQSNLNSEFEEKETCSKERSIADELRLNEPELTVKEVLQDVAKNVSAEVAEFNNDTRRSERIFKRHSSGGAKISSLRKTI